MIIKLAFKEIKKNIRLNLLLILQLAALLVLTIFTVSTVMSQLKYYLPFEEELTSTGRVLLSRGVDGTNLYSSSDSYKEKLKGVKNVVSSGITYADIYINGNKKVIQESVTGGGFNETMYYDQKVIDAYKPLLSEGKWFTDVKKKDGYIDIVITDNSWGLKVGDTTEVVDLDKKYKVRVIGKILDGAKIFNYKEMATDTRDRISYEEYFTTYSYKTDGAKMIFNYEDIKGKLMTIGKGVVFLEYGDNLSDSELKTLNESIDMIGESATLSDANEASLDILREKIYILIPMIFAILVFLIISAICVTAINTKKQLRNYGIFYTCGSRWRQCTLISVFSTIITSIISAIIAGVGLFLADHYGLLKETVIAFEKWQILACVAVILLNIIVSIVMPITIIGRTSPTEIIKSNE